VRALSERHVRHYYSKAHDRMARTYPDPPPKAGEYLGKMLMENLGTIGLNISRLEVEPGQRIAEAKAAMNAALTDAQHL
jgi:hypothetical protein